MTKNIPEYGSLPWRPAEDARVEVLDEYEIPLAGLFRDEEGLNLFACIAGRADAWNVWAYTRVEEADAADLRSSDRGVIDSAMQRVFGQSPSLVALAESEGGVREVAYAAYADEIPGVVASLIDRLPDVGKQG